MADQLKALINARRPIKAQVTRFKTYFENFDKTAYVGPLQERFKVIENIYPEYNRIQTQIETAVEGDLARENEQENDRLSFEEMYYDLVSSARLHIKEHIDARSRSQTPQISNGSNSASLNSPSTTAESKIPIKLPVIALPKFDGSPGQWLKFKDTYESLIHSRDDLSNIQRFHYLNSALTGEAARVIQTLGVSDNNYDVAWNILKERYEDPQELIDYHAKALLNSPVLSKESATQLRTLIDETNNHLRALEKLGEPVESWDTLVSLILTSKLDFQTKRQWKKRRLLIEGKASLKNLLDMLEKHCKYLESDSNEYSSKLTDKSTKRLDQRKQLERSSAHVSVNSSACAFCSKNHALYNCDDFKNLSIPSRISEVQRLQLCFNCLRPGHRNKTCTLGHCKKCTRRHNSLLHLDKSKNENTIEGGPSTSTSVTMITRTTGDSPGLLATALVHLEDSEGKKHECRALLDPGSQSHLITEGLCQRLKLRKTSTNIVISGIEQGGRYITMKCEVKLKSRLTNFSARIACLILPNLTNYMPTSVLQQSTPLTLPQGVVLADPYYNTDKNIELIIGTNLFWDLLCVGQRRLHPNQPRLQKTQLGWVLAGPFTPTLDDKPKKTNCLYVTNEQLHQDMERFWKVEQGLQVATNQLIDKNDVCERRFLNTTHRDETGRFVVEIPFKDEVQQLGDSRHGAYRRFLNLERRLDKDLTLKEEYVNFMKEYEMLGHMTESPSDTPQSSLPSYFLPHHAVIKQDSTTTKLRVVFDGSFKTSSGLSLNDVQHVGPAVQEDLFSIMTRFRTHNYVLSADVAKMYRQINVTKDQRCLQQILWRADKSDKLRTYQLNTVTYGTASAPYLATRCLKQLGDDHKYQYPMASNTILRDFYVDDLLTGTRTIEEACSMKIQLEEIFKSAGMTLRKWASNEPKILEMDTSSIDECITKTDKDSKTLGLWWLSNSDKLKYTVRLADSPPITKRSILSTIAQIFDPLGLVGPATIQAKIIMQKLWQLNIHWDESLPQDLHTSWVNFHNDIGALNQLILPRQALCKDLTSTELHGFCDASEKAYGACIYLRSRDTKGNYTVRILCAKSRVAPLKTISLPRLELCGALLLAKLYHKVKGSLDLSLDAEHFWCDSTITLAWINSPPNRWKTFVANRVTEIQELTNHNWHHVPTETNPADIISRGINPNQLSDLSLWWNGPSWLSQDESQWPTLSSVPQELPEARNITVGLIACADQDFSIFEKYSSLQKLVRVIAYCYRFLHNTRSELGSRNYGTLTPDEQDKALTGLLRLSQTQSFAEELRALTSNQPVSRSSKLFQLQPFLDNSRLIRVGGRLANAPIAFDKRHPIILASNHRLTKMIIEQEHRRLMHAGCQTVMCSIRNRFWPLNCRNTIKGVLRKCIPCFRANPIGTEYIMGNLPARRVTPSRPFFSCGVDYAGPIYTKYKPRDRTFIKSYICIFVCFATKAVHLELATDLSTDAFLNCFKRFVSRRGICRDIYSDNGKNFVGARNELNDLQKLICDERHNTRLSHYLASQSIHWHLIPPHAPHFGGLWEAAVKSAKHHLKRVTGETRFTFEEYYTILTQIEACLNSRPISPMSNDPTDLTPLTPGHFLIGDALTAIPQHNLCHLKENRLNRYQLLQQVVQHFWKRWQTEYLHTLQQRYKWNQTSPTTINVGTMVVVREDNLPPLQWRLGRIIDLHSGADNITRVVSIKVSDGIIKRPVSKICILPMEEDRDIPTGQTIASSNNDMTK